MVKLKAETKRQIIDIVVVILIFTIACILGKAVLDSADGSWISFNGPVFAVMTVGFGTWFSVRKSVFKDK